MMAGLSGSWYEEEILMAMVVIIFLKCCFLGAAKLFSNRSLLGLMGTPKLFGQSNGGHAAEHPILAKHPRPMYIDRAH